MVIKMSYSLVAVSGGSDSMSLLDMLYKQGKKLIVCHVNYRFRESSDRDEQIVRKYCGKYSKWKWCKYTEWKTYWK